MSVNSQSAAIFLSYSRAFSHREPITFKETYHVIFCAAPAQTFFASQCRHSGKMSARALTRSRHFRGRAQAERLDSRETIREKMVAIQKFPSYVFISRR